MNTQPADGSGTPRRRAAINWLLWTVDVLATVLVLVLLVAVALPLIDMIGSGEGLEYWAGVIFGLIVLAILVGIFIAMVRRFIRGRKLPLDARRLHRSSVAIGGFAFVFMSMLGTMSLERQFGEGDATFEAFAVVTPAASLLAWVFHRLLFANMKQRIGVVDDRTFDERYKPARHFVALVALLILNVFNVAFFLGREEPINEPSLLLVGGPLVGVIVFYKVTITITAWRIRRKLAAAQPPSEGGAA